MKNIILLSIIILLGCKKSNQNSISSITKTNTVGVNYIQFAIDAPCTLASIKLTKQTSTSFAESQSGELQISTGFAPYITLQGHKLGKYTYQNESVAYSAWNNTCLNYLHSYANDTTDFVVLTRYDSIGGLVEGNYSYYNHCQDTAGIYYSYHYTGIFSVIRQ